MKLDAVTTIAIGDLNRYGVRLQPTQWNTLCSTLARYANHYGTVVAETYGYGVTSDQPDQGTETTFILIVINIRHLDGMRMEVSELLHEYYLSSACYSTDLNHEPVFASTVDGYRPTLPPTLPPTTANTTPTHGGYPNA